MKALLGATAVSLTILAAGAVPAAATDINIFVQGEEDVRVGPGPHGERHGKHDRMHDRMHGHDRGHGHHGRGHHARDHDGDRHGGRAHQGGWHGGKKGHGRRLGRMLDLIERYDQNGDGEVTQAEIDQFRADRLSAFDADGNGTLSLREYEALWLDAMRERMVDRFQAHDDDGDGQVTVEEFSERTGRMVLKLDRNEDEAISMEDMRRGERGRHRMRDRDENE